VKAPGSRWRRGAAKQRELRALRDVIDSFSERIGGAESLERCLDLLLEAVAPLGFSSIIYDYAPVPVAHDGRMIRPNLLNARNIPNDFTGLWCDQGYYRIDPVQQTCIESNLPFLWSFTGSNDHLLERPLTREHQPVIAYLKDTRLSCGATVPIHSRDGSLATVTAIRIDAEDGFERFARRELATFAYLAHFMHEAALRSFDEETRRCHAVSLSPREIECLRWAARGKTAEDIAEILDRAPATICLHLNNAQHKLGAQNRAQAIARAAHYRLLGAGL
jgi:LuxR family transcriptional regulator